jgi:hypothetical protein
LRRIFVGCVFFFFFFLFFFFFFAHAGFAEHKEELKKKTLFSPFCVGKFFEHLNPIILQDLRSVKSCPIAICCRYCNPAAPPFYA